MVSETPLSASNLPGFPENTLCLTFDDGPAEIDSPDSTDVGPHSLELAQYLASVGVQATFFMVGRQIAEFPGIAEQIADLGHQIGIHTYDHMGLDDYLRINGGDVVRQITLTTELLPPADGPYYLRAPYGQWSPAVAQALNNDLLTSVNCCGPIHWDNEASDWDKWLDDVDPQIVAQQYFDDINRIGKGVVLMHDNMANVRRCAPKNRGFELAKNLIPMLLDGGYTLSRVDGIPGFVAQDSPAPVMALRARNRAYVSKRRGTNGRVLVGDSNTSSAERFTVQSLGANRVAFQVQSGEYLSLNEDGVSVTTTATQIGDWQIFEAIPCGNGQAMFRTFTGDFLKIDDNSTLVGNGGQTDPNNGFSSFLFVAAAMNAGT